MKPTGLILPLLIVAVALAFAWWLMRRFFTGRVRRSSNPPPVPKQESEELIKLRRRLAGISAEEREAIDRLQMEYRSQLSTDTFGALCLLAADTTKRPLSDLPKLTLHEDMGSSADYIDFVFTLEDLLEISISSEQSERILTFGDLVRFVESATPETRINTGA